jgi:cytochrome c oxidase subunit 1
LLPLQRGITCAAILLGSAQLLFLINLILSWKHGRVAPQNPWDATTLEWAPAEWFAEDLRAVERGPYVFVPDPAGGMEAGVVQWKSGDDVLF